LALASVLRYSCRGFGAFARGALHRHNARWATGPAASRLSLHITITTSRETLRASSWRSRVAQQQILAWISDLRGRLERGELAGRGPVDIGDGTAKLPLEHTVRIMLHDLDDLDGFHQRPLGNGHPPLDDELKQFQDRRRELLD